MSIGWAVILVGSAKPGGTSTSEALARYAGRRLEAAGVAVDRFDVVSCRSGSGATRLADGVSRAELLLLVSPLYVDSFPYLVTRTLESLASRRLASPARACGFAALVHCGFPEAAQCGTAIAIAQVFARRAHFAWGGALALGESGLINGRDLDEVGGVGRNVRAALDSAATALADAFPVPETAVKTMARPMVPPRLYTFVGDLGWRRDARRNGVQGQLKARPYEP